MFCEKCGKKLEDGVKFCPSCGNRVEIPENQTDTVHEQPEKSKKSRKKSKLPLVLIAVLAIILIVGGILYGTVGLNLQKDKLAVKIKKAGIPQYTEEMNEIVDEWDDFGIFSISDKRNDLHKLKKIVNYLDEYNAAADEYKSMNKEKEQYALDEDSYKEYENALHDCSDAIEQKNPESLINAVEIAKETLKDLKKADDSYVDDRVKMYEGLDLKDAGDDVVSGYKKNLKEIQDLTGKGKKDYKAIKEAFSKNTFYRFLNSAKTNWLRFTSLLAADIVNHDIKGLTNDSRKNVFIIDDSLFNRTSCKKTELGSKVFDHTDMRFKKGFRMLTLSWSDGNTLIPVNSCLLASAKTTNIIGPVKDFDNRTLAGKRRKLAQTKAPEAMMALLDTALSVGLNADYVLFDSWFSNPVQITAIHSKGMDVIAMIKKSSRIKYSYGGKQLSIKEIYSKNKKRHGRSKYLLSVDVMVGKETPIPAKIVCVRNKSNRKDWLAFICTDTTLSEEEIIRVYGKRWQIEVFFKTCKSMLNLIGECHSLSYDALTAHVAIVFTRYMLLAMEQRQNEDQRTLGELFFFLIDEMADITFRRSLCILMDALMASLQEILKLSDKQLTAFTVDFEARLPEYLRNALHPEVAIA